jgi:hypothetical protein
MLNAKASSVGSGFGAVVGGVVEVGAITVVVVVLVVLVVVDGCVVVVDATVVAVPLGPLRPQATRSKSPVVATARFTGAW